ncbi:MAG TPA: tetratricopeptide repeat protein [Verrucomicrobiae bacterium]|jgi:tetratricopeptide (TPR) repeat protein
MSRPRLIALLLALGTMLVYLPVLHHEFVNYDDGGYVTENTTVKAGLTWHGIKWAFTTWVVGNWHPVTMLSHMLDCQLFGVNSGLQHYENVLFHAANTVLLFWLLLMLTSRPGEGASKSGALWPCAFVAALFAWHPMHVESVAWIAERKDVLSTFFELLALVCYGRYIRAKDLHLTLALSPPIGMGAEREQLTDVTNQMRATEPAAGLNYRVIFYLLSLFFFALGLMSKPMLVTMPFVLLLLDFWPLSRVQGLGSGVWGKLVLEKIPFFLLTAVFCAITFWSQHGSGAMTGGTQFPLYMRVENSLISYGRYLEKMVWPVNLAVIYPLLSFHRAITVLAGAMAAGLALISWVAWKERVRCPYLLTGWFWYVGTLVPVIGLVQVGGASMADRYSYFPFIGIFIAIAFGVRDLIARFRMRIAAPAAVAVIILAVCIALTERQLTYWQNSITLFRHAIAVTHDNDIAHSNLGLALEGQGNHQEALAQYREALRISPDDAEMHNNIADLYYDMGRTNDALDEYHQALKLNPRGSYAWINIGNVDVALGRFDDAMTNYNQAAQLAPDDPEIPFIIGKTLLAEGHDFEAVSHFRDALKLDPDNFETLTYMARVLASDENPQARNGPIALAMAAKANDLTGGIEPVMWDTMAMAYAEMGQFDDAQIAEDHALKLATAPQLKGDLPAMNQRLQLYKDKQPYRQSFVSTHQMEVPGKVK